VQALIQCLERLSYKEGSNVIDKGRGLDHLPDSLSYLVAAEFPIIVYRQYQGRINL
jgi:hypothetical protein